ncbi:tryptophan--tRNA ligase [Candidatus Jorgensenbacteria bacterium]|nr:tryptophan--tRNA ligase [Candidatus Jorgensenbacteria bacterium]
MKPVLVSGIQPTGRLHLGNYLGALKHFVELQKSGKYECYFFIADLHSLTETFSPEEKTDQINNLAVDYLAAGLDPEKSTLFIQSLSPAHTEMAWVLNCITPFGELRRMTQFKEKSENDPENINVGLFTYPVLMAVDILFCNPQFVPVGEDQLQHLELTRTLARKFNTRFGKTFTEPKPLLTEVPRLMSLDDPTKKMSKSRPAGCLFLDDTPEEVLSKIKTATTDSGKEIVYDTDKKPGVSNLLLIYSNLSKQSISSLEKRYQSKGYAEFKKDLARVVVESLLPFQTNKKELMNKPGGIKKIFEAGSKKAASIANKKLIEVKKKIGLVL